MPHSLEVQSGLAEINRWTPLAVPITQKVGRFLPKGLPQVPLKVQSFVSGKSLC
jgi:hypothetical protein